MAVQIVVTFACGHVQDVDETVDARPVCQQCGCEQIQRVKAPKPRITFSGV